MINESKYNSGPEEEAKMATQTLSTNATRKNLTLSELTIDLPFLGQGGIKSAILVGFHFHREASTIVYS